MAVFQYVFQVQVDKYPRAGTFRWRWTLLKAGSVKIRSTLTFETEQDCRKDAEDHKDEICKAPILTVAAA